MTKTPEYWREYREKNREKLRKYQRLWHRKYRKENREVVNETRRRFYKRHKIREQTQARSVYWKLRQEVINKLGGKCINCGITDIKVLEINHVHGGGTKHLKKVGTTMHLYDIKSNRTNRKYDIRCANCNRLYEYERGNYYSE